MPASVPKIADLLVEPLSQTPISSQSTVLASPDSTTTIPQFSNIPTLSTPTINSIDVKNIILKVSGSANRFTVGIAGNPSESQQYISLETLEFSYRGGSKSFAELFDSLVSNVGAVPTNSCFHLVVDQTNPVYPNECKLIENYPKFITTSAQEQFWRELPGPNFHAITIKFKSIESVCPIGLNQPVCEIPIS
jgi:hypothetical protein